MCSLKFNWAVVMNSTLLHRPKYIVANEPLLKLQFLFFPQSLTSHFRRKKRHIIFITIQKKSRMPKLVISRVLFAFTLLTYLLNAEILRKSNHTLFKFNNTISHRFCSVTFNLYFIQFLKVAYVALFSQL